MTYQRITSDIRERIIGRLKEQFQPRFDELDKLERAISEKIYEEMFGPHAVMMASLPEGWLPTAGTIIVHHDRFHESFKLEAPKRFTAKDHNYHRKPSQDLLKLCKQFREDKEGVRQMEREAISEARRIIGSVTTVNKLIEVWPEIASVIKDIGEEPNPTAQVPAPVLDKLNEILDLPVEEVQQAA